jgi:mRNA-degrading endonuclease RelE of RelBE toxin-antitoxin system
VSWELQLGNSAAKALRRMAKDDQERISAVLNAMRTDPLAGDVTPLRGQYAGSFRRRVGSWRIIFALNPNIQLIEIQAILRRTSTTY